MDLRPDIVFVVSGAVWRDYEALRDKWDHPLCVGLRDECVDRIRQAMQDGANDHAAHCSGKNPSSNRLFIRQMIGSNGF